jgi:hypothetical protein
MLPERSADDRDLLPESDEPLLLAPLGYWRLAKLEVGRVDDGGLRLTNGHLRGVPSDPAAVKVKEEEEGTWKPGPLRDSDTSDGLKLKAWKA